MHLDDRRRRLYQSNCSFALSILIFFIPTIECCGFPGHSVGLFSLLWFAISTLRGVALVCQSQEDGWKVKLSWILDQLNFLIRFDEFVFSFACILVAACIYISWGCTLVELNGQTPFTLSLVCLLFLSIESSGADLTRLRDICLERSLLWCLSIPLCLSLLLIKLKGEGKRLVLHRSFLD